jgi:alkanesulfonate monooxygenase SsuD/methylene tetrahydromethanopterin reductase-like flavin-dependent oxidoreductase (luciferase family)
MIFDIFFSICQTPVNGFMPDEKGMFRSFFEQVRLADELGFDTAWVAETHLSTEVQKQNPGAVIPHFDGEIGLNTDLLQLAHKIFAQTKNINVGSAIRNILCNGGPMAHAEAVRTFLTLHGLDPAEKRLLHLGFASGRFQFSNAPYGIKARNATEVAAWPALRGLIFAQATEIFLRFLRGDIFSSRELEPLSLDRSLFRSDADWVAVQSAHESITGERSGKITVAPFWQFDRTGVIPFDTTLDLLRLTIGSHEARHQILANSILPCGVFNLSITPDHVIEQTHVRMQSAYNTKNGPWKRSLMPRTVLVFIDPDEAKARAQAQAALSTYWSAMEGTIDPLKVEAAVGNALVGTPAQVREQVRTRFQDDDRVMLWFDFNNHDSEDVMRGMKLFANEVAAKVS